MTNQEAIRIAQGLIIDFKCESDSETIIEFCNVVIKALEQTDVLDKVETEIENHCGLLKENHCKYCSNCYSVMGVREILEVIDKYRKGEEV